jgi:group I intron endonuclease
MTGVYKITNLNDNKIYIGSAKNVSTRIKIHLKLLRNGTHHNIHLQRAYNRDGEISFIFELIEDVADINTLLIAEQKWINKLVPEYNICKIAGSPLGVKRTKEYCDKMSRIKIGKPSGKKGMHLTLETREILRQKNLGKKQSNETIEKRMLKIRGIKKSSISIERCRQAYKNRSQESLRKNWDAIKKPIYEFSIDGVLLMKHNGIIDATKFHKISHTSIQNNLKGRSKTCHGKIFKYQDYGKL